MLVSFNKKKYLDNKKNKLVCVFLFYFFEIIFYFLFKMY